MPFFFKDARLRLRDSIISNLTMHFINFAGIIDHIIGVWQLACLLKSWKPDLCFSSSTSSLLHAQKLFKTIYLRGDPHNNKVWEPLAKIITSGLIKGVRTPINNSVNSNINTFILIFSKHFFNLLIFNMDVCIQGYGYGHIR